ncbi:hypothetical protein LJK87_33645 [Paenibacillus sp. P25]|nr:hypothetical protein LJK87_33645 [Paenibacillus sp. P25]
MSTIMKAKEAADALYGEIGRQVEAWKAAGHSPAVAAVLVEGDPASVFYAKAKRKVADRLGISFELYSFREASRETELIRLIERLNEDPGVHGIMLELPRRSISMPSGSHVRLRLRRMSTALRRAISGRRWPASPGCIPLLRRPASGRSSIMALHWREGT